MKKIIRVTTIAGSFLSLLEGQLKFMSNHYKMIAIASNGGQIENENIIDVLARKEKVETIHVEMTRRITPIKDIVAIIKLYKIFRKERPEIVHSHTPKAGTLSMIAAKLAGVPHRLHTIAGLPLIEATSKKRKLLNFVEKLTYACASKIYPNSFGLKEFILKSKFTTHKKLKVLGKGSSNGIDTSHFNPELFSDLTKKKLRKELGIKETDFVYIFMGRLVKDKGINELIKAYISLTKSHKNTKLLLLGAYEKMLDPLETETEIEIEENPNILSIGWQTDVRPYLAISKALVFPSYREGFPNTVMQACAMNLPSIVSDINGCNELITHNLNGLIIPAKNTKDLEKAMEKLFLDKNLYNLLALNTRKPIHENYERAFVWQEILKEYNQLLGV